MGGYGERGWDWHWARGITCVLHTQFSSYVLKRFLFFSFHFFFFCLVFLFVLFVCFPPAPYLFSILIIIIVERSRDTAGWDEHQNIILSLRIKYVFENLN